MGAGKYLMIIAGIITIVATYLFSFFHLGSDVYGWGVGAILVVDQIFVSALAYGEWLVIVIEILILIFLAAGVFQLIGAKVRALGFIGSLFALGVFVYFMLIEFQVISSTAIYAILFSGFTPNALGPLPLHVQVGNFAGLGTYLLLGGAVLGFIGTFVGRD